MDVQMVRDKDLFRVSFQSVTIFGEQEYIIHVNDYDASVCQILEDRVHHGLERSWGIAHSKEHNSQFE